MVVDAHVHIWDPARLDYPWLDGIDALNHAFLPADIDRSIGGAATDRMIFVQAGCRDDQALDEARWVHGLADAWPELAAIVAAADLRSGSALDAHLDALFAIGEQQLLGGRHVRVAGIRHLLQDESDDLLADRRSRDALLDGMRRVADRGLTFDVCVRHQQLDRVIDLLELVPQLPIVLDHVGKPPIEAGIQSAEGRVWANAIDRMALLPLAHVKLSGLAAEASSTTALDAHAEGFLALALLAFGPERAMLGSDWPVSALTGATGTLAGWRERVRRAADAAGVDASGISAIEGGTAARFYLDALVE